MVVEIRRSAAALLVLTLSASLARAQTAGFNDDGSAYASGKKMHSSASTREPASTPAATAAQQNQLTNVVGGAAGGILGSILAAPGPAPYVRKAPAPVVGDEDESSAGPAAGAEAAQDIINGYHPEKKETEAAPKVPFDQDASIERQRAYVKKKVKYSHDACDPTGTDDMLTGVDCSCLMLHGNPDYLKKTDGTYARTADEQHALMVERKDDSLAATELQKGDQLFLRNKLDDPAAPIAHTGRVTKIEACDQCSGCSAENGDVCLAMLHAPRSGTTVTEANTTFHNDKDKSGNAAYCIHKRDGTISQCLTGGGRYP